MYKVLIADDHPFVRQGLRRILESTPDITVIGEAASRDEVLAQLRQPVDVLTLDLSMPGADGLTLLIDVKARYGHLPIVMVTMYADARCVTRVLHAGAMGFVPKTAASTEFVAAIRSALSGHPYISPGLAEDVFVPERPARRLSPREREVLRLISEGKKLTEMADVLHLSPRTINTYQRHLMEKLHLTSAKELTRAAVQHHLTFDQSHSVNLVRRVGIPECQNIPCPSQPMLTLRSG